MKSDCSLLAEMPFILRNEKKSDWLNELREYKKPFGERKSLINQNFSFFVWCFNSNA